MIVEVSVFADRPLNRDAVAAYRVVSRRRVAGMQLSAYQRDMLVRGILPMDAADSNDIANVAMGYSAALATELYLEFCNTNDLIEEVSVRERADIVRLEGERDLLAERVVALEDGMVGLRGEINNSRSLIVEMGRRMERMSRERDSLADLLIDTRSLFPF